jgi:hypothetical protein
MEHSYPFSNSQKDKNSENFKSEHEKESHSTQKIPNTGIYQGIKIEEPDQYQIAPVRYE